MTARERAILTAIIRRGIRAPLTPIAEFGRYQRDPVPFVRTVLQGDPWAVQQQIMHCVGDFRRTAVRSCHHSGKTWTAATLVHWWLRAFDPSLVITTAPTDRQVKEILWNEIGGLQRRSGLAGRLLTTQLEVSATQRAYGFTTNTPERFQGWHCPNILVVVDEASGVSEEIYQAIEGILTGPNARLLLIGNPNQAMGTFYEAFRSPLYQKFHIQASDVPEHLLPAAWAAERLAEWGEESPAYQVRVLGEFPPQGDDGLLSLKWVEEAQNREIVTDAETDAPCEIGVDVARFGGDESVAYVRRGAVVVGMDAWRGLDTVVSTGRVAALHRRFGASLIKCDDPGVGGGVTDQLKHAGLPVVGVNVGETAWDAENYALRRSELFCGLRERFKQGDISIPKADTLLLDQLLALKFSYTARGQLKLESKDDLKKRRGTAGRWSSPDRADALMLAFARVRRNAIMGAVAGPERAGGWVSKHAG